MYSWKRDNYREKDSEKLSNSIKKEPNRLRATNVCLKPFFLIQNHLLNLCFSAVDSQRLL